MVNRTKETIVKILIVVTALLLLYVIINPTITAFILMNIFGILMIISMSIFNVDLTSKKSKPVRKQLSFNTYFQFKRSIVDYLVYEGFQLINTNIKGFSDSELYLKKSKEFLKSKLDFVLFIKLDNLEKDNVDDTILNFLEEKYSEQPADLVTFTTILCVDKVTDSFNNYITTNTKQTFGLTKLYIGVSLEDNNLYIVTQKDGVSLGIYRKLKKWFEKVLDNCRER